MRQARSPRPQELPALFLAEGCRDIVFINNKGESHYSFFDRKEGYEDVLRENGRVPQVIDLPSVSVPYLPAPAGLSR